MKKYALIAFAMASSGVILTGSPAVEAAPSFPIVLDFNYDWGCTGSAGQSSWTIQQNGTWSSTSYSGTWNFRRGTLNVVYDSGTTYSGRRAAGPGLCLEGTMVGSTGNTGCWDGCVQ